ncbi:hypothetical protein DLJ53_00525 [Acuticoccus sediminis]|uniref:PilZ domain-containing protein n=1 Tax=Acuticoccus sediminis TaxID=2184697 RepID=A0A8B2P377_9HYPH|nr:PilZ domain-containing protein [Acuticoccus sediminis]RAI03059.1 hypothetical protein DLJ53_00525 [Acuticoccus sediminis]
MSADDNDVADGSEGERRRRRGRAAQPVETFDPGASYDFGYGNWSVSYGRLDPPEITVAEKPQRPAADAERVAGGADASAPPGAGLQPESEGETRDGDPSESARSPGEPELTRAGPTPQASPTPTSTVSGDAPVPLAPGGQDEIPPSAAPALPDDTPVVDDPASREDPASAAASVPDAAPPVADTSPDPEEPPKGRVSLRQRLLGYRPSDADAPPTAAEAAEAGSKAEPAAQSLLEEGPPAEELPVPPPGDAPSKAPASDTAGSPPEHEARLASDGTGGAPSDERDRTAETVGTETEADEHPASAETPADGASAVETAPSAATRLDTAGDATAPAGESAAEAPLPDGEPHDFADTAAAAEADAEPPRRSGPDDAAAPAGTEPQDGSLGDDPATPAPPRTGSEEDDGTSVDPVVATGLADEAPGAAVTPERDGEAAGGSAAPSTVAADASGEAPGAPAFDACPGARDGGPPEAPGTATDPEPVDDAPEGPALAETVVAATSRNEPVDAEWVPDPRRWTETPDRAEDTPRTASAEPLDDPHAEEGDPAGGIRDRGAPPPPRHDRLRRGGTAPRPSARADRRERAVPPPPASRRSGYPGTGTIDAPAPATAFSEQAAGEHNRRAQRIEGGGSVIIGDRLFDLVDWSALGISIRSDEQLYRVGDIEVLELEIDLGDYAVNLDLMAEVVNRTSQRTGWRFRDPTEIQRQVLRALFHASTSGRPFTAPRPPGAADRADAAPAGPPPPARRRAGFSLIGALMSLPFNAAVIALISVLAIFAMRQEAPVAPAPPPVLAEAPPIEAEAAAVAVESIPLKSNATTLVLEWAGDPGQSFAKGQTILTVSGGGEEAEPLDIVSPCDCYLARVLAQGGELVHLGEDIALLYRRSAKGYVQATFARGQAPNVGTRVTVDLPYADGSVEGTVQSVGRIGRAESAIGLPASQLTSADSVYARIVTSPPLPPALAGSSVIVTYRPPDR